MLKLSSGLVVLLCGGWMILDGLHVILKGKYFGPEKPGPWSIIVSNLGFDPFKMGYLFLILGTLWIIFFVALMLGKSWAWYGAALTAAFTLWYLPIGTVLSITYLLLLTIFKSQLIGSK